LPAQCLARLHSFHFFLFKFPAAPKGTTTGCTRFEDSSLEQKMARA
jgi:hypothetical protein